MIEENLNSGFLGMGLVSVTGKGMQEFSGAIVMFYNDIFWALFKSQKKLCITSNINFTSKEKKNKY